MDIKSAVSLLKGLQRKLETSTSEEDRIFVDAIETIVNSYNCERTEAVLYICNRRKCVPCSFPKCTYTSDVSHAASFILNDVGMYVERDVKRKKKKLKQIVKEMVRPK